LHESVNYVSVSDVKLCSSVNIIGHVMTCATGLLHSRPNCSLSTLCIPVTVVNSSRNFLVFSPPVPLCRCPVPLLIQSQLPVGLLNNRPTLCPQRRHFFVQRRRASIPPKTMTQPSPLPLSPSPFTMPLLLLPLKVEPLKSSKGV